jgi:hypothetical protein
LTTFLRTIATVLLVVGCAAASRAQGFQAVGPNECLNCHDHAEERAWYEKKEIPEVQRIFPDKSANAGHINSLKQLEAAKSKEFAAAIGLADKYDLNGACVSCHATVFAGDANAGVSCESCHGPGSGYLKPHQTKGAYEESVARYGMTRLIGNIQGWTQQCTNCHVMNDDRLIKAGHPSGDDFDLGKRFLPVSLHFKKKYDPVEVGTIGKSELAGVIRRRRPGAPAATPETLTAAPAAAPSAAPAPPPSTPAPQPPASAPPEARPAPPSGEPAPRQQARVQPRPAAGTGPPPGSPTSIEPADAPPPPPPAVSAAPSSAPAVNIVLPESSAASDMRWIVFGAVVLLVGVGAFLWGRSRK